MSHNSKKRQRSTLFPGWSSRRKADLTQENAPASPEPDEEAVFTPPENAPSDASPDCDTNNTGPCPDTEAAQAPSDFTPQQESKPDSAEADGEEASQKEPCENPADAKQADAPEADAAQQEPEPDSAEADGEEASQKEPCENPADAMQADAPETDAAQQEPEPDSTEADGEEASQKEPCENPADAMQADAPEADAPQQDAETAQTPSDDTAQPCSGNAENPIGSEPLPEAAPFEKMETGALTADMWSEVNGKYVFGECGDTFRQQPGFYQRQDDNKFHRPDLIADIACSGHLLVMGASLRGEAHHGTDVTRQDSFALFEINGTKKRFIAAALADGVGTSIFSEQLADFLVNNVDYCFKQQLTSDENLREVNWEQFRDVIHAGSLRYCTRGAPEKELKDWMKLWASTLELIIIEDSTEPEAPFVHVTVCGDGASYLIHGDDWYAVKSGKQQNGSFISNMVTALPSYPKQIIVRYGTLKPGEQLFLVTDGLGDGLEEDPSLRAFFGQKLQNAVTLPEFVKIISTSVEQMGDDKTGILIRNIREEFGHAG